jgi:hypothetical protein
MALMSKKTTLYAKIETTSGTDSTPTAAANAIMAYDVSWDIKGNMLERAAANNIRSLLPEVRGKTTVEIKFKVPIAGSGTAGTPPRWAPLLIACDRAEVDGASSDDYIMATTSQTVTIWVNFDGILFKSVGCAGECEIDLVAGEIGWLNFTFQGVYALATDSAIEAMTQDTTTPPVVKGTTITMGGQTAVVQKLNLKFGNKVVERTSMAATEGVLSFIVGDRMPSGSMTVEADLRATESHDWLSYFHSGTTRALSFTLGATAGNITRIQAPNCIFRAPKLVDNEGIRLWECEFQLSSGPEMDIYLT